MPAKAAPTAASAALKTPATLSAKDAGDKSEEPSAVAAPEDDASVRSGMFSFSDGAKYKGEFVTLGGKVVRQGVGTFVNGPESYEGHWENDQMHGRGVYHFATGARYEGEFHSNLFHGAGVYQWSDGATYDGAWQFSRMHGDGAYVDKDGVAWRGRFFNGKYDNGRVFHTLR